MAAVFGIDAHNAERFLDRGVVCLDRTVETEEVVFNTFRCIRTEDVIFIKNFTPQTGLQVIAAGVAKTGYPAENESEVCIPVEWVWRGEKLIDEFDEKCSRCADPLYEEHNIAVQREIINLMLGRLQFPSEW